MATRLARLARPLARLRPSQSLATPRTRPSSTFQTGPSPPRLPSDEQAEFERLQRTANTQEGFNATSTPDFSSSSSSSSQKNPAKSANAQDPSPSPSPSAAAAAAVEGIEAAAAEEASGLAPTPLRKGAPPEFEGDVNPRTGEVGGPKNEPLRWGAGGDYSFNGRVTDF
ncbi:hypothetical protein F5B21DRAFT_246546 [Xylaria acuta]|nr:hypothetical protein F5B21DRAFT_246546 [Xylaria acuta]